MGIHASRTRDSKQIVGWACIGCDIEDTTSSPFALFKVKITVMPDQQTHSCCFSDKVDFRSSEKAYGDIIATKSLRCLKCCLVSDLKLHHCRMIHWRES